MGDSRGIVGDWIQNHALEGGAFEAFSKFSCPVGWGIGGDLCRDCNVKVSGCPYETLINTIGSFERANENEEHSILPISTNVATDSSLNHH